MSKLLNWIRWHHVAIVDGLAIAWFVTITLACRFALPDIALFRCPIGLCLGGYEPAELRSVLTAIGSDGRGFLVHTLLPLDTVMPVLATIALMLSIYWLTRPEGAPLTAIDWRVRLALVAVPLLYCFADFGENWQIARVLHAYPDIPDNLARSASRFTSAKSQTLIASSGIVVAFALARWWTGPQRVEGNC